MDFSATSEKALQYAVPIASRFCAQITLRFVSQVQFYANEFAHLIQKFAFDHVVHVHQFVLIREFTLKQVIHFLDDLIEKCLLLFLNLAAPTARRTQQQREWLLGYEKSSTPIATDGTDACFVVVLDGVTAMGDAYSLP